MAGRIELGIHYKLAKPAATPKGDAGHCKNGGIVLGVSALHYSTGSTEGSEGFGHWLQLMHCA